MQIDYTIAYPSGTLRKSGVIFPMDSSNAEYQAYASWVSAGNGPVAIDDPAVPAARQHLTVSPVQIRRALNQLGMRRNVEDFIANSGNKDLQDFYEFALQWESDHPLLLANLQALGMTEDQVYSVFELAASL